MSKIITRKGCEEGAGLKVLPRRKAAKSYIKLCIVLD
jgi:hypothetical protein